MKYPVKIFYSLGVWFTLGNTHERIVHYQNNKLYRNYGSVIRGVGGSTRWRKYKQYSCRALNVKPTIAYRYKHNLKFIMS